VIVDNSTNYSEVFKKPPPKIFFCMSRTLDGLFQVLIITNPEDHDKLYLEFKAVLTMRTGPLAQDQ
jgi:hypothetical protein